MNPHGAVPAVLDPATRAFLETIAGGPDVADLSPGDARAAIRAMQSNPPGPPARYDDVVLDTGAGAAGIPVRLVRPSVAAAPNPLIVYLHGGGWIMGGPDTHLRSARDLAEQSGAAVALVDYRLAPEHPHPAPLDDALLAVDRLSDPDVAAGLDLDPRGWVLAGDSAGAHLAFCVARERIAVPAAGTTSSAPRAGAPAPSALLLTFPAVSPALDTPSAAEFAHGYFLTVRSMRRFWRDHAGSSATGRLDLLRTDPRVLAALPPTLLVTAGADPLRDEGEALAARMAAAGAEVTAVRFAGSVHAFTVLDPLAATPAARTALQLLGAAAREARTTGAR